ncbi:MAG: MAPEG family protein [Parasphingorhabdus sp.]|uniref:MAPEG family protein n=1 Tax=Parasphingorhabdus sp. TaxID=2709688 RepID=UPI0032678A80
MNTAILAPAAVLVLWSLIILFWMAGTRFPALAKTGANLSDAKPGGRGSDLEGVIPDKVNWKSHNFTHLMEQPTLFYATVIILAISDAAYGANLYLAWAYVIIRIIHSIWQVTVNLVKVRLVLFVASTICLVILAINAVWATLF